MIILFEFLVLEIKYLFKKKHLCVNQIFLANSNFFAYKK